MLLQLRIVSPHSCTDSLVEMLKADDGVVSLELRRNAAMKPADGDVLVADVLRDRANELVDRIQGLAVDDLGELSIIEIGATRSERAHQASLNAHGRSSDVIVWTLLESRVHQDWASAVRVPSPASWSRRRRFLPRPRSESTLQTALGTKRCGARCSSGSTLRALQPAAWPRCSRTAWSSP